MTATPGRTAWSLRTVEHGLYLGAASLLIAAAVALLGNAVYEAARAWQQEGVDAAIIRLLDRVLLALMLAEIVYTLRQAERTHALTAAPFLVIGIIAAVRHMLIITAESVSHADLSDPKFLAALAELVVLDLTILVFTLAIRWQVHPANGAA
ncbi:phosphate-starvation-inducible PsiE family protein [Deinococcus sp. DB0503]|uniref:phosphate-starvation-inducible PsiE family protein n=1 Tax=Deinococcus sp. DB0503 TaxID=2479203 RepID=UPI0018DFC243|nr:hypothetical protein [Deinococcus sp. DB0503]